MIDEPRRRASDRSHWGRFAAWWRQWGVFVQGVALIAVTVVLIPTALTVRGDRVDKDRQAKVLCERSKRIGLPLADYFERENALSPAVLAEYRRTVPKSCA